MTSKKRPWSLGLGPAGLAPQESRDVQGSLGGNTLLTGLSIVNTGSARGLEITGLFVGNKLQRPPTPGRKYPVRLQRDEMKWRLDPCPGALFITIQVKNVGTKAQMFACSIRGLLEEL